MSRAWNAVLVIVILAALGTQIALLLAGGPDVNAVTGGAATDLPTRFVNRCSYFTIQSNLLVLASAIPLVFAPQHDGALWRVLRLDALIGITVTGIVFATVLAKLVDPSGVAAWTNAGFHYFAPVWALAGWLLFGPRPRITWRVVALAFAWPAVWIAYTLVRGAAIDWYPYPFLDAGTLGYARVSVNVAVILAGSFVLSAVLMAIDRRLPATRA